MTCRKKPTLSKSVDRERSTGYPCPGVEGKGRMQFGAKKKGQVQGHNGRTGVGGTFDLHRIPGEELD